MIFPTMILKDTSNPTGNLEMKSPFYNSIRTKYGHHLAYQKMTASTGNMFISGFPARKPDYLVTTGTDQPTTEYREKKKTGLTEDFGIKPERFSHKRMNIAARNKSSAIYPYDKQ